MLLTGPFQLEMFYASKVPPLGTAAVAAGYVQDQDNSPSGYLVRLRDAWHRKPAGKAELPPNKTEGTAGFWSFLHHVGHTGRQLGFILSIAKHCQSLRCSSHAHRAEADGEL